MYAHVKVQYIWMNIKGMSTQYYLIRWGFITSVLTDPSISLIPYSTSVNSPALNIIQTDELSKYNFSLPPVSDHIIYNTIITSIILVYSMYILLLKAIQYTHVHVYRWGFIIISTFTFTSACIDVCYHSLNCQNEIPHYKHTHCWFWN